MLDNALASDNGTDWLTFGFASNEDLSLMDFTGITCEDSDGTANAIAVGVIDDVSCPVQFDRELNVPLTVTIPSGNATHFAGGVTLVTPVTANTFGVVVDGVGRTATTLTISFMDVQDSTPEAITFEGTAPGDWDVNGDAPDSVAIVGGNIVLTRALGFANHGGLTCVTGSSVTAGTKPWLPRWDGAW